MTSRWRINARTANRSQLSPTKVIAFRFIIEHGVYRANEMWDKGWPVRRWMKHSPDCICIVTGRCSLSLSLSLHFFKVFFPVETMSLGLVKLLSKTHSIGQISNFRIEERERETERQRGLKRVVASPTPLLPSCKGNISCLFCCKEKCRVRTDRCMLLLQTHKSLGIPLGIDTRKASPWRWSQTHAAG
jgi:hypothetical protein